jgi:hypothetical protein
MMAAIAIALFLGVSYLANETDARPSHTASVLSEISRAVFPGSSPASAMYYVVQVFTLAILVLAANTSFQGFPRLSALLARDPFYTIHRHYRRLGRRLVAGAVAVAAAPPPTNTVALYVEKLDEAMRLANWYARRISGGPIHTIHVLGRGSRNLQASWSERSGSGIEIEPIAAEERTSDALLDYVWTLPRGESSFVTIVVPEQFRRPSLPAALGRRTILSLKLHLLEPSVILTSVPYPIR